MRCLIWPAMVMKAFSTLVAFFALVSRNSILTESANSLADSKLTTWRWRGEGAACQKEGSWGWLWVPEARLAGVKRVAGSGARL